MKKIYLNFLLCCIAGLSLLSPANMLAQDWEAPALPGNTPESGISYYIYNVGSKGYLNRGGEWAMQSVVTASPTANASASIVKWTAINTSGSSWTFQYNKDGLDVTNHYLFAADVNGGWTYTDNSTNNTWDVQLSDGFIQTYTIQIDTSYDGYNATQYLGSASTVESSNKGYVTSVKYNKAGGDDYTQWKFVLQADIDLYNARVLLDRYMNYAKTKGGINISSYITTYDAGVTADINTAAANLLTALGRTDVTVPNFSFETDAAQANWTKSAGFVNKTYEPLLFPKDGTNFTIDSIASGSNLAAGAITQTITGLANGLYGMVATGLAVKQSGANPLHTGAFFTAGASSTEISSGADYNVDYAIVANATNGSNGTLTIGCELKGTVACNWVGFDNFRLYYYGPVGTPILTASESSFTFEDVFLLTDTFSVTGLNLTEAITLTAPAGITLSTNSIPANPIAANVIVTYNGTTAVDDYITLTSGTNVVNISVKAASNAGCFTPLYARGNIISNPYLSSLTGYTGWGSRTITTNVSEVYCGRSSFKSSGSCGGSLDYNLTGKVKANTVYRFKAMVNSDNEYFFTLNGCGINGVTDDFQQMVNTGGTWQAIDFYFTTGSLAATQYLWMNSCTGSSRATLVYLDNLELYDMSPEASLSDLTVNGTTVNGFDSAIYTYNVVSATVPTVAAVAAVAGAVVEITQATAIPGSATVKVTSADGKVICTYTINFTSASIDASLSAITVGVGTLKPAFNTATTNYYVELASGTSIPIVTATATDAKATVVVTPATVIPGITIVNVTAEDGIHTSTYNVNFWDLKLTGAVIGHASSWNDDPATYIAAAFDGNKATFVDAPSANGYVGLDLGAGYTAKITSMRYFPRTSMPERMVDGEIRGANMADLSDAVILYTIADQPSIENYTDAIISGAEYYRYIYYYSETGYCNIGELELYGTTLATKANIANNNNGVRVVPSVSSGNFKVEFGNNFGGKISVYDLQGRLVLMKKTTQQTEVVTIPSAGVYLMKIATSRGVTTTKLVKTN